MNTEFGTLPPFSSSSPWIEARLCTQLYSVKIFLVSSQLTLPGHQRDDYSILTLDLSCALLLQLGIVVVTLDRPWHMEAVPERSSS
jgi:hypothetical protein